MTGISGQQLAVKFARSSHQGGQVLKAFDDRLEVSGQFIRHDAKPVQPHHLKAEIRRRGSVPAIGGDKTHLGGF